MPKKNINDRCPLSGECERKHCEFVRHELDCAYYESNSFGSNVIQDQEEKREEMYRERERALYEAELSNVTEEDIPVKRTTGSLVNIAVDRLYPHPDNPRKDLGDLTELAASIRENGIFQNLTVVPKDTDGSPDDYTYTVIIGHRRLSAAKLAGLTSVPCVITEMTEKEQLQTMLMENMQRSDLTVYEQAQGFQMMLDLGSTVKEIAEKSGFSVSTVKRRVKMTELDQDILKEVSDRQISISDFDKLAQIEDIAYRNEALKAIGTPNFACIVLSKVRRQLIEKRLPIVKQMLRDLKAKQLKDSEKYSTKFYSINPCFEIFDQNWDEKALPVPEDVGEKIYYYLEESGGYLRFYRESEKRKPEKRSPEEIAKEKAIADAWEESKKLASIAYACRLDFVKCFSITNQNRIDVYKGAVIAGILRSTQYIGESREILHEQLELKDGYDPDRTRKMLTTFQTMPDRKLPLIVYALFGDSSDKAFSGGYGKRFPEFYMNPVLDALYDWLISLGYEMSDDEKALRDGTHEVFQRGKKEAV